MYANLIKGRDDGLSFFDGESKHVFFQPVGDYFLHYSRPPDTHNEPLHEVSPISLCFFSPSPSHGALSFISLFSLR